MWVLLTHLCGTHAHVVEKAGCHDEHHNCVDVGVLQIPHTPPLTLHPPKSFLNGHPPMVDPRVLALVFISKGPVLALWSDNEWEGLSNVGTVPQQLVLPHPLLPVDEDGGPQHPGIMYPT